MVCSFELILFILKHYFNNKDSTISKMTIEELKKEKFKYFDHQYSESLLRMVKHYNKNPVMKP